MPATVKCHTSVYLTYNSVTATIILDSDDSVIVSGISVTLPTTVPGVFKFSNTVVGFYKIYLFANGSAKPFWYGWCQLVATGSLNASDSRDVALSQGLLTGITTAGIIALRSALAGVSVKTLGLLSSAVGISLPLVQGDTYEAAAGTAIPFPCPNASLVNWTPELAIDVAGQVVVVTTSVIADWTLPILFDLSSAQSTSLPAGVDGTFVLRFTRSSKTHTTTVDGLVTVAARIG